MSNNNNNNNDNNNDNDRVVNNENFSEIHTHFQIFMDSIYNGHKVVSTLCRHFTHSNNNIYNINITNMSN